MLPAFSRWRSMVGSGGRALWMGCVCDSGKEGVVLMKAAA